MNILKKINKEISPHITHLCNSIIRTGIYPDKLKVSKILPILKPSNDMYDISGYPPINILGSVDNILQSHIKDNLLTFLIDNNILLESHHGGLKGHGTDTALTMIMNNLHIQKDMRKVSCILQTDLSSAYDTIDHLILIDKLYHYGIRGKESDLLKSYLKDRTVFVELDTFRADNMRALDGSVVQG